MHHGATTQTHVPGNRNKSLGFLRIVLSCSWQLPAYNYRYKINLKHRKEHSISYWTHFSSRFEFVKQNIALTHSLSCDLICFLYILHSFLAGVFNLLLNRSVIDTYTAFLDIIYAFVYISTWVARSLMPWHKEQAHLSEKTVVCSWMPRKDSRVPQQLPFLGYLNVPRLLPESVEETPPECDSVE